MLIHQVLSPVWSHLVKIGFDHLRGRVNRGVLTLFGRVPLLGLVSSHHVSGIVFVSDLTAKLSFPQSTAQFLTF